MNVVARGEISGRTRLLALIGHPVGHSLSPAMHNAAFAADDLDFVYVCLDVDPDGLPAAVLGLRALKFRGFNVTMPHKRAMVPLVDDLDEGARVSGAVNTVVVEGSRMRGYNTDGGGMVMACEEAGIELLGKSVLLLGSGGAATAIAVAFGEAGIGELHIVSRNTEHAARLQVKLRLTGMERLSNPFLRGTGTRSARCGRDRQRDPPGDEGGRPPASTTQVRAKGKGDLRRGLPSGTRDAARPSGPREGRPRCRWWTDAAQPGRTRPEALDGTRTKRKGDGQRHFPKMATWGPGINRRKSVGANCREGRTRWLKRTTKLRGTNNP